MAIGNANINDRWAIVLVAFFATTVPASGGAIMTDSVQIHTATAESEPPHLIYMFPGVEGGPFIMQWAVKGLRKGGVTGEIRVHRWRRLLGLVTNLISYKDNRRMAAEVAGKIAAFREQNPDAIIDLVGYSGGGGLAIMVAEALPEDVRIRNLIMCQPALSPDYNLTVAITRVEGRMINMHSRLDWAILGLGTMCLGTIDRKYVGSAGKSGFDAARAIPDEAVRERFVQCDWKPVDAKLWHFGMHLGMLTFHWNRSRVAPCLRTELPPDFNPCDRSKRATD